MSRLIKGGGGEASKGAVKPFSGQLSRPTKGETETTARFASPAQEPGGELGNSLKPAAPSAPHPGPETGPSTHQQDVHERALAELQEKLAKAEGETRALEQELEQLATRTEALQTEAYERGRKEGAAETSEEAVERRESLVAAISAASADFAARSAEVELLALSLAKAALVNICGQEDVRGELLRHTIRHQNRRFADEATGRVRLSPSDIGSKADAEALASEFPELDIVADQRLSPGDCHISLALGEADIGITGQIERLASYFDELAKDVVARTAANGSTPETARQEQSG